MSAENDRLLEVALRIADGRRSDWDQLDAEASTDEQEMLRSLRFLSRLGALHRDSDLEDADAPKAEPGTESDPALASVTAGHEPGSADRWGDLVLLEQIGEGASSEVYRARDTKLDRIVAAKILRARDGAQATDFSRTLLEARRLAAVRHPSVVSVHFADSIDGRSGICMEYLKGVTLETLLRERGPFGPSEIVSLGEALCGALAAIHAAGLVHQDVKTENILREEGGRIVLMDLGLGGGTPLFVAPEAMEGRTLDARSDLYSLGVVLYRMATGSFPIQGTTVEELRTAHRGSTRTPLRDRRPEFPPPLAHVIERALSADPRERPGSAGEMERALIDANGRRQDQHAARDRSRLAPRVTVDTLRKTKLLRWAIAASVTAVVAVFWFIRQPHDEPSGPGREIGSLPAATGIPFHVAARVFRGGIDPEPLRSGDRLALGDSLSLFFDASESLYVYVFNRDQAGHAYLVFPLAELDTQNPLPPHQQQLPGTRGGRPFYWQVTAAGGREELLLVASRERLIGLESEALALARPDEDASVEVPSMRDPANQELRGLGGFVGASDTTPPPRPIELFETAASLSEGVEEARGVWMRKIAFQGPAAGH